MSQHLYLETSVLGFYYDELEINRQKREATRTLFDQIKKGLFVASISPVVAAELNRVTNLSLKRKIISLIDAFNIMPLELPEAKQAEIQSLVNQLITKQVIPETKKDDAAHIAFATLSPQIDFLVTWNYIHLANVNVFRKAKAVMLSAGYEIKFEMATPEEVIKYEET